MSNVNIRALQKPLAAPALLSALYIRLQKFAAAPARAFSAWRGDGVDHTRLYRLNDHMRRDIGISRYDIGRDPMESYWRD